MAGNQTAKCKEEIAETAISFFVCENGGIVSEKIQKGLLFGQNLIRYTLYKLYTKCKYEKICTN